MNEFKYNIGYALSGGFIKGFAHLGIMQALHEHGIRPEILSGVSAGALAAVFYADGKEPYHIVELFEHHSFKELTTFSINKQGLLKLDSFIDFLNSNLESKTIEELKIPTIITATDLDHGRIVSFKKGKIAERLAASCCMPILFAPIRINNTYYVDGGILMNLPVSPIRKECEKVIALNVDPLVADEYSKNVVSIALRAYHFIFQANTLPQKGIADLLIESYGLEEYSNRELERAEEIFEKDTIRQRNSWTDYSWRMEQFGDKQKKIKWIHKKKLLSIRYSPVYSGTTACVVSLMVLWRKTVAEKWPISRQRL